MYINIIIIIIIIITFLRTFHVSVTWWFSTGVLVTVILFESPELFLVFWPIQLML